MPNLAYRPLWTSIQLLLLLPFLFLVSVLIDMSLAEPGKGYIAESGQKIQCETLAPRSKSGLRCSAFGSKEKNPAGYAIVISALAGIVLLGWWCGRPGRGIQSYRTPAQSKLLAKAASDNEVSMRSRH